LSFKPFAFGNIAAGLTFEEGGGSTFFFYSFASSIFSNGFFFLAVPGHLALHGLSAAFFS